jgi:NAD(P)-dependent dehydrogenase (short-subunit alcohol dehydrogenase family)
VSELDGKRALVFGGANGIGRATAVLLARRGAHVLIADVDAEAAEKAADAVGSSVEWAAVDVTRPNEVESAVRAAAAADGHLDMVVHSIYVDRKETSLTSAYLTAKFAIPFLKNAGGGSITFVSSIQAVFGYPQESAYAASKAGLVGLTRQVACEYAPMAIRVNCVLPSFILTEREQRRLDQDHQDVARLAACFPLGRVGYADDVAEAIAFLSSERARFITGVDLLVDGGMSIQPATHHLSAAGGAAGGMAAPLATGKVVEGRAASAGSS